MRRSSHTMSQMPPDTADVPPTNDSTVLGFLGLPLVLAAVLLAVSYPQAALVTVTAAALTLLGLTRGLGALVRRTGGRDGQFEVPGIGTVRVQVTP